MKKLGYAALLILILGGTLHAQTPKPIEASDNDPRRFVTVSELNGKGEEIELWNWNTDSMVPLQPRELIDIRSKVRIRFDKEKLVNNGDFKGNISIVGTIVSNSGGDNAVEVFPKTGIGKESSGTGLINRPPLEVAKIFTNLISSAIGVARGRDLKRRESKNIKDLITLMQDLYSVLNSYEDVQDTIAETKFDLTNKIMLINDFISNNFPDTNFPVFLWGPEAEPATIGEMNRQFKIVADFAKTRDEKQLKDDSFDISSAASLSASLTRVGKYLSYFKSSGIRAEDAFLSFLDVDYIWLDEIQNSVNYQQKKLNELIKNSETVTGKKALANELPGVYQEMEEQLLNFAGISTAVAEGYFNYKKRILSGSVTVPKDEYYSTGSSGANMIQRANREGYKERMEYWGKILRNERNNFARYLAIEASKLIHADLNFATIDLVKERAADGNTLYLYVQVDETIRRGESGEEAQRMQRQLPIGRYELRETGWGISVLDNFSLIDRINAPDTSAIKNVSPSNFKGAPGISLLAGYRRSNDEGFGNQAINFFQPSIGIDISYVDFSTGDDVEVGAGVVLGLFKNQVFLQYGVNLNQTGDKEESPHYFGIGFSFAKLAGKFAR